MAQSFDRYDHNDDEREGIRDHSALSSDEEITDTEVARTRDDNRADDTTRSDGDDGRDIKTPRPRARRTSTRNAEGKREGHPAKTDSGIIQFSERASRSGQHHANATEEVDDDSEELSSVRDLNELTAQGFTADEAIRLIHVSDRLANGHEARESQTTLRRLRFTRWLIEHGMLDEFTA